MEDQILVQEIDFDEAIDQIQNIKDNLSRNLELLRKQDAELYGDWEGESGQNYAGTIMALEEEYSNFIIETVSQKEKLRDAKIQFLQLDQALSDHLNSKDTVQKGGSDVM